MHKMYCNGIAYAWKYNFIKDEIKGLISKLPENDQEEILEQFDEMAYDVFTQLGWLDLYDDAFKRHCNLDAQGVIGVLMELYGGVAGYGAKAIEFTDKHEKGYHYEQDGEEIYDKDNTK